MGENQERKISWKPMQNVFQNPKRYIPCSSDQSLSCVRLFATPWTAARQTSLSITNSRSLLKLMSIESVMPSNHLILCRPLRLLPSIFPSIRVFSSESVFHIRWPKYWSFSFSLGQGGRDEIQRSAWCAVLKQFIVYEGAASWIQMAVCQAPGKEGPGFEKCLVLLDFILQINTETGFPGILFKISYFYSK